MKKKERRIKKKMKNKIKLNNNFTANIHKIEMPIFLKI